MSNRCCARRWVLVSRESRGEMRTGSRGGQAQVGARASRLALRACAAESVRAGSRLGLARLQQELDDSKEEEEPRASRRRSESVRVRTGPQPPLVRTGSQLRSSLYAHSSSLE